MSIIFTSAHGPDLHVGTIIVLVEIHHNFVSGAKIILPILAVLYRTADLGHQLSPPDLINISFTDLPKLYTDLGKKCLNMERGGNTLDKDDVTWGGMVRCYYVDRVNRS